MNRWQTLFKEAGRLVVLAIPGVLIQLVTNDAELAVWGGGALLTLLKGWDRAIHEDPNTERTGLLPF